jgi:hypothetical protein
MFQRLRVTVLAAVLAAAILALPASAGARAGHLHFITSGLTCSGGVCALAAGSVGANYGQNLAIAGESCGSPCVSLPAFTVVSGKLPAGLIMPQTYGCCGDVIAGTPTAAGAYRFTVQVKDGVGDTARQGFSIAVGPPAPLEITFPATCCPAGSVGASYLQNFFVSGGVGPMTGAISAGALPPGLHLSASPPISITGTPTTAGTFAFTVRITDSTGAQATEHGSITIG